MFFRRSCVRRNHVHSELLEDNRDTDMVVNFQKNSNNFSKKNLPIRVFAKIGFFKNTKYFPVFFLLFFWPFETVCENSFFSVFFSWHYYGNFQGFPMNNDK
jgi:hypothetical protein